MPLFLTGFFTAMTDFLLKLFGKKGAKIAFFTVYTALLITILHGVSDFALNNIDVSSFITPSMCWLLNELNAFGLLATYFSFLSVNWLKSKTVHFWTSGN